MPLDPILAGLIAAAATDHAAGQQPIPDVATARVNYENDARTMTRPDQRDPVADAYDTTLPSPAGPIPVRIYRPNAAAGPLPVIVWFHGGGWMIGSLDTGDTVARALCHGVEALVVSVDYRLAPEHPWPAGLEDACAALDWVAEHAPELGGSADLIVVGGDSSGGNIAAILAQRARKAGPALAAQILMYPATDLDIDRHGLYPSMRDYATDYILTTDAVSWCIDTYLPSGADVSDPRISPARYPDLAELAPAVIALAEFDPLRDQGVAYADALRTAGVSVAMHEGGGLIHGSFDMLGIVPATRREFDQIAASVRRVLVPAAS